MEMDDDLTSIPKPVIDDEYAKAGIHDPRILITTSRDPSSKLVQFAKELKLIIPNAEKLNRGHLVVRELVAASRRNDVTDIIIAHEHRGVPDGLIVCHLPYGPTAYFGLYNCVTRHEILETDVMSQSYPHLVLHNLTTQLGERVGNILKYLFPVPRPEGKRVITFANQNDFISFRHHMFHKEGKHVQLKEIGPRFELKLYQIKLGTIEMKDAKNEWVLRPYFNTSKKRKAL